MIKKIIDKRKTKGLYIKIILYCTLIILALYLINSYAINFTSFPLCDHKSVSDTINANGVSDRYTPLHERYDLNQIAKKILANKNYHGSYDSSGQYDKQAYLSFTRNFGEIAYTITMRTDFSHESFRIDGIESCLTPDIYIKRNIESIYGDMQLSENQYEELKRSYVVTGIIDLF